MTLTFPRSSLAFAGALAITMIAALPASAQTPPSDLPPLPAPGAQPAPAPAKGAPAKAPAAQAAPGAPAPGAPAQGTPPGYPPPGYGVPPGLSWMSPNEVPPGYAVPGYYPYAMPAPAQATPPPDYRIPPPPPRERRDSSLMIGGIIAVSGGMAAVLTGAYLVSSAAGRIDIFCDSPSFPCAHKTDAPRMTAGVLMMIGGGLAGAAGIPMWAYGSQYVITPPKDQKKAALVQRITVSPFGVDVAMAF